MKLGYIRVSTQDQNTARQIDGLKDVCDDVIIDKVSATAKHRPGYEAAISRLQSGDTFVVWSLDRAFRSTVDAIQESERFRDREIQFQIINLNIDTSTAIGEFFYTLVAGLAQLERQTLIERTKEGIAAAKRRGKHVGRPAKLTGAQIDHARAEIDAGRQSPGSMASLLGVSRMTLWRALQRDKRATLAMS